MVSYQLLVFGIGLVVFGIAFTFINDQLYDMTAAGLIGYTGINETFLFGQYWLDFLWGLFPSLVFVTGGLWCSARAMKG
ncbi:MAG: hypothetical protein LBU81_01925 [Methanosarcinales archaeon]|jgi:hypothetical protein|nr:hypothetical protein [Methanosarcinales archaeon]